jgi:hypothetical protein
VNHEFFHWQLLFWMGRCEDKNMPPPQPNLGGDLVYMNFRS